MTIIEPDSYPNLPKWPGVYITGKDLSVEQAKSVIMRTDRSIAHPSEYTIGGNDRLFQKKCFEAFGWGAFNDFDGPERYNVMDRWKEIVGIVETGYVYNDFLASSYIGGPTGWCHPNGKVLFEGHNYGKWPSVEDIVEDWRSLVAAFPFIDLHCTLFGGESHEEGALPVCTIRVRDRRVDVLKPDLSLHGRDPSIDREEFFANFEKQLKTGWSGSFWPKEWIDEFAKVSTDAVIRAVNHR